MDYLNKNFSKREKILFLIFIALILELVIYFIFISPKLVEFRANRERLLLLNEEVEDSKRELEEVEKLKGEIESLKEEKEGFFLNSLSFKNYEAFKKTFPLLDKYENVDNELNISLRLKREELENILKFSKYYIFDEMTIKREKEHSYLVDTKIRISNDKNNVKVVKKEDSIDKNISLSREYFSKRADVIDKKGVLFNSKDKQNKENLNKITDIKNQEVENKNKMEDTNPPPAENSKEAISDEEEEIFLEAENFSICYPENSIANLMLFEENKDALVYYKISENSEYKEILLLFNEVFDFSKLNFDLIVGDKFNGEFGLVTTDRIPINKEINSEEVNKIEFENIKNLKGVYYRINSLNEEGVFSISNLRGSK